VIAKAGEPMVKVVAISQETKPRRVMLAGMYDVPEDIDSPFKSFRFRRKAASRRSFIIWIGLPKNAEGRTRDCLLV
jgi:antitoxin (DNA-binding transcriptional repressor) of toxin-antitoxin stability system